MDMYLWDSVQQNQACKVIIFILHVTLINTSSLRYYLFFSYTCSHTISVQVHTDCVCMCVCVCMCAYVCVHVCVEQ